MLNAMIGFDPINPINRQQIKNTTNQWRHFFGRLLPFSWPFVGFVCKKHNTNECQNALSPWISTHHFFSQYPQTRSHPKSTHWNGTCSTNQHHLQSCRDRNGVLSLWPPVVLWSQHPSCVPSPLHRRLSYPHLLPWPWWPFSSRPFSFCTLREGHWFWHQLWPAKVKKC